MGLGLGFVVGLFAIARELAKIEKVFYDPDEDDGDDDDDTDVNVFNPDK